ncbi:hypothetical protein GCM10010507_13580 [Streptomyces cinnamoneus]|uniref:DUF2079 domain-containing protein n=1 Tax=Streptomyces cinnamoneus TaxID=53446 RepID=A0A918WFY2_STRCJ|nr:hypothetical protein GCM10010507_13580 [Streptomyces cinnamoneus]
MPRLIHRHRSATATGAGPDRAGSLRLSLLLGLLLFAVYAAVSVRRQQRMLTAGYDLGIFEQTVRSYAHGHLPVVELKGPGFQELGDHFSPILATLAPFYRLWPSPLVLLLAQAALMAVAVVPLTRWAQRDLGTRPAVVIGLGYGLSWGIASAVGFDFHEVCFAVPLLAFSLTALGQGRLRAAALWALPLLLVKEDLGLTVAVTGALIAWRGGRRLGAALAVAGLAGTLLEVLVVVPAFRQGDFTYLGMLSAPAGTPSGATGQVYRYTLGLFAPGDKVLTLILLLAPTAFLAVRSPLLWAVVPTLGWRFTSGNPLFWGTGFHYSAVLMPIVFAAYVDALTRRPAGTRNGRDQRDGSDGRDRQGTRDRRARRYSLIVTALVSALLLPLFPLFQLARPGTWRTAPRVATAHRIMHLIPDGATVGASNRLAPQLANRTTVSVFGFSGSRPDPQWLMLDTVPPTGWPIGEADQARLIEEARTHGYGITARAAGYLLLHRTAHP